MSSLARSALKLTNFWILATISLLAACALPSNTSTQAPTETAKDVPPPLNLCLVPGLPLSIAKSPGYAEYSASVTRADGAPVLNLDQKDFIAYRGSEVLKIESFRKNEPVSIVLVFDSSGSMMNKLEGSGSSKINLVRDAISREFDKLNACDELAIITFSDQQSMGSRRSPYGATSQAPILFYSRHGPTGSSGDTPQVSLLEPLTTDHVLALNRLNEINPYGPTPLYDAIDGALELLAGAHYRRHVVIVITDGIDNVSTTSLDDLTAKARRSSATIFTIGLGDISIPTSNSTNTSHSPTFAWKVDDANGLDPTVLKRLSGATGGQTFIVSSIDKDAGAALTAALQEIDASLAGEYTIGVDAGAAAPNIAVANQPDEIVKVRLLSAHPVPQ